MHALGEALRLLEIGLRGLAPDEIGVGRVGLGARDAGLKPVLHPVEAFRRALRRDDELAVALVDVGGDELRRFRVGARDDERRDAHHVGGKTRGDEVADVRGGRDQHLAAHVAALLFRSELVLEVHAGGARLDIGLHDLEDVERPAEAGFRVGDDRREPGLDRALALHRLDLVGALQRAIDLPDQLRPGIRRVERLVGIHRARRVGVGRDLPARQVDGA